MYSNTALELFWNRAETSARVSGYELNKNGERVWVGDVTSYFDTELSPGSTNNYAVVAVDENGNRSDSSRVVTISMDDRQSASCSGSNHCTSVSFSESEPSSGAGSGTGGVVEGVSLSIYSNTAAELFWQRNNQVTSYDIYRDDVYLQKTDGRSFFDDDRLYGYDHEYKIVAIGIGGNQLDAVTIT